MGSEVLVHKVTLGSGKIVLIKDPKIKHQEMAARAAGNTAKDSQLMQALSMKKELLKMLIVKIDDTEPTKVQLEDLDSLFTLREYGQLSAVLTKLMGGDDEDALGNFQMEMVTTGGN